ncbi:hypothetical protein [Mucilaginibacter segetis]|uniref:Uncharacterized protein n=1 Tax=Mucilaginibacter segetis TaxID=2793071 RepID=A0A934PX90_9SPHI|nr:hypothetical protein [Mucilaginibacter segetis]MBK0381182.1 hypothetical protein [Mucilaginibacter segetis]
MHPLYLVFIPFFIIVLYKKATDIILSKKSRNYSKLKADMFFFFLMVSVIIGIVAVIEKM